MLKSVLSYLSGVVTDILLKKEIMSKTSVRSGSTFISRLINAATLPRSLTDIFSPTGSVFFECIGSVLAGLTLIGVSYAGCDSNMAIICMSLCVILNACFITGSSVAIVDMSPNFCSKHEQCVVMYLG